MHPSPKETGMSADGEPGLNHASPARLPSHPTQPVMAQDAPMPSQYLDSGLG